MHIGRIFVGVTFFVVGSASAFALELEQPNDNYSSLVLSYRNSSFATPYCIGNECHTGLSGPAAVYARQIVPNFALGLSGSYLQSNTTNTSLKSTGLGVFAEAIAGIGSSFDVGASVAALSSHVQASASTVSSSTNDTGSDVGVFGKVFLTENRSVSVTLSYDSISYQKSGQQSVLGLSLVTIFAKHHRLALSADQAKDSGGKTLSKGLGFGYSYLF